MYLPDYLSVSFPLPPPGPDKGPVCFQVDEKWLPYLLAVVKALTTDGLYSTDADAAIGEAYNLLGAIEAGIACPTKPDMAGSEIDDCMGCCIRMRNGVLQVLQCGEWVAVDGWDPKAIASAPTVGVDGTPVPPAGKCQTYIGKVNAASKWALPATVNTGDVITVTNALGSWWTPLDLGIQRCPDGLIFIAGGCVDGTSHTESGDPLNTAPHDCLIAYDGTHYYDCSAAADGGPAVFTIGPGVSSATLVFMMNTPDTIGFGEVQFDVEICNNQTVSWTHTTDFSLGLGGWAVKPSECGVWTPSVGWQSQCGLADCTSGTFVEIITTLPSTLGTAYTGWEIEYNVSAVPNYVCQFVDGGTVESDSPSVGNNTHVWSHALAGGDVLEVQIASHESCPGAIFTIKRMTFTGTGVNPF